MRQLFLFAVIALFSFGNFSANPGSGVNAECILELNSLISSTGDATSLSMKDKNGLLVKAINAKEAYLPGKTGDALDKLYDYQSKLEQLINAPKPKISGTDYEFFNQEVGAAIDCLLI